MSDKEYFKIFQVNGYSRRPSCDVAVGNISIGGKNPIRLQTMTTTNTNSIDETVAQAIRCIEAGAELIRITTQGVKEAKNLALIKDDLRKKGFYTPIIADIHFNPKAAMEAAKYAHKIRINPGNFSDSARTSSFEFNNIEYEQDLLRAEERFLELLNICKQNDVAIRIGVNHGSLSQRIMSRYGDTPLGMAQSAMEFICICAKHYFHKLVISMKSSNTRIMVQATRLLVSMMHQEGLSYPLHLGVTEAGEGEDGRIKSAVGIGALLIDGIGDTIRVSLTEEPENEIPVAKTLVDIFTNWNNVPINLLPQEIYINPFDYRRRESVPIMNIGGNNPPVVVADLSGFDEITPEILGDWGWTLDTKTNSWLAADNAADYIYLGKKNIPFLPNFDDLPLIGVNDEYRFKLLDITSLPTVNFENILPFFIDIEADSVNNAIINLLLNTPNAIVILKASSIYQFYNVRNVLFKLIEVGAKNPCIVSFNLSDVKANDFEVISSAIAGSLFIDGLADGLMLSAPQGFPCGKLRSTSFGILQAARVRISKTEFISCPGCGRTLFNLNDTLRKVKVRTSHLKGLKIAVMGCIVNGPGEMADADYGYVGSGNGRVTLYHKREVVEKNIPDNEAVDKLIELIKANGDWVE